MSQARKVQEGSRWQADEKKYINVLESKAILYRHTAMEKNHETSD